MCLFPFKTHKISHSICIMKAQISIIKAQIHLIRLACMKYNKNEWQSQMVRNTSGLFKTLEPTDVPHSVPQENPRLTNKIRVYIMFGNNPGNRWEQPIILSVTYNILPSYYGNWEHKLGHPGT